MPAKFQRIRRAEMLLVGAFKDVRARFKRGEDVSMGHYLRPLGPKAGVLGCALVALPFLSPVSLGPLAIPACLVIALLGINMIRRAKEEPMPERIMSARVPETAHKMMSRILLVLISLKRRWVRPRLLPLVEGSVGRVLCGALLLMGSLLLLVPVPGVPFTNTLPALGIICASIAWVERDGLLTVFSMVSHVLTLIVLIGLLGGAFQVAARMVGAA